MRNFIAKVRHARLFRIPGYAIATGVFLIESVYLVYIFRASSDQSSFTLTVKERDANHDRIPVIERHVIPEAIVAKALETHPEARFKL